MKKINCLAIGISAAGMCLSSSVFGLSSFCGPSEDPAYAIEHRATYSATDASNYDGVENTTTFGFLNPFYPFNWLVVQYGPYLYSPLIPGGGADGRKFNWPTGSAEVNGWDFLTDGEVPVGSTQDWCPTYYYG